MVAEVATVAQLPQALLARAAPAAQPHTLHLLLEIHSVVLAVQVELLPQELVALVVLEVRRRPRHLARQPPMVAMVAKVEMDRLAAMAETAARLP